MFFVCLLLCWTFKGYNALVRNGLIYTICFTSMAFKSIICCKTQTLCELHLCWQHMIDSILQMGLNLSYDYLLCLNLSYDYLHTDLATDNPKMLMWVNAHTYALHICEHPLLYALLEEKIYLYTRILFFIHGECRLQSYAARNRSRSLKCQLVKKNGKLILNGCIFKRAEHNRDLYLIHLPSVGQHLLGPNLKLLSPGDLLLPYSFGIPVCPTALGHLTLIPSNCCQCWRKSWYWVSEERELFCHPWKFYI